MTSYSRGNHCPRGTNWMFVRYGGICVQPMKTPVSAFDAFSPLFGEAIRHFPEKSIWLNLPQTWRKQLTQREVDEAARFTAPSAQRFYSDEDWALKPPPTHLPHGPSA